MFRSLITPFLVYLVVVGNAIMFLSAYGFYHFEHPTNPQVESYGDALWWAICTVSTVGYGDIFPITNKGRLIGAGLIVFGVMFFLTWTATLAFMMSKFIVKERK